MYCNHFKYLVFSSSIWGLRTDFNQSLDEVVFPEAMHKITFGDRFNQDLAGAALPKYLNTLEFGKDFNHSLEHVKLPVSLKVLVLGDGFTHPLEKVIPTCFAAWIRFRTIMNYV